MSNLVFLLGAVGLSILGSLLLWLRYRKPTTFMSSISDFQREMDALGRDPVPPRRSGGHIRSAGSAPTVESSKVRPPGASAPPGKR